MRVLSKEEVAQLLLCDELRDIASSVVKRENKDKRQEEKTTLIAIRNILCNGAKEQQDVEVNYEVKRNCR